MSMIRGHKAGKSCGRSRRKKVDDIDGQFDNPIARGEINGAGGWNRIDEVWEYERVERVE